MKVLAALLGALLVAALAAAIYFRRVEDDPVAWHVDLTAAERTGKPNDYLAAPPGATAAEPDRIARVHPITPRELLSRFDAVAMAAARTQRLAGSPDGGRITYVQRSRNMGFPDYITVEAVEVPGGAALVVWSRSRFGYSDLGVNRARVEDWLEKLEKPAR
jgi:uncharacterized protein (DUF1499 family)